MGKTKRKRDKEGEKIGGYTEGNKLDRVREGLLDRAKGGKERGKHWGHRRRSL